MLRATALISALTLSSTLAAQKTWIVDQARGSGYDFVTIQQAVNAAKPGDTVLVRTGSYQGFDISKGLRIVGEGRVLVTPRSRFSYAIWARRVPAGQVLSCAKLVTTGAVWFQAITQIQVQDCAGLVTLEHMRTTGASTAFSTIGSHAINATNCKAVTLNHCIVGFGLRAVDSRVAANNTIFRRYDSISNPNLKPTIDLVGAQADLAHCIAVGETSSGQSTATPAVVATRSSLVLRGTSTMIAGAVRGTSAAAVDGDGQSRLVYDPRVRLQPSGNAKAVNGFGSVRRASLPTIVAQGGELGLWIDLQLTSSARDVYILKVGPPIAPIALRPFGDKWTDPRASLVVWAGILGASGSSEARLKVPNDPRLRGLVLGWQGLAGAWPKLGYSNPAITTLR